MTGIPAADPPRALEVLLAVAHLDADDAQDALRRLADTLVADGAVTADFPAGLRDREDRYPTGLPTEVPTAIPHADPRYVLRPGIVLATLARPVAFGEMGAEGLELPVRLIAMPLLQDATAHLRALQGLMAVLRDRSAVEDLLAATDDADLAARATRVLDAACAA